MGRNNYFKFKQFMVVQEKSAMKVGIDGVVLGGWVRTDNCKRILDVGTGTGLIALMLAQRSNANITAIEIEENAAVEAKQNVANSPWHDRIDVHNYSLQEFAKNTTNNYDLIVSNPPFFSNDFKAGNKQRTMARHNDSLPFDELIICSLKLLNEGGKLALILPSKPAEEFIKLAKSLKLHLNSLSKVYPNKSKPSHRYLMEFSKLQDSYSESDFFIRELVTNEYSDQYKKLLKEFYLRF